MSRARGLRHDFGNAFHAEPRVFRAPGRVNLIGEHTDYSQGLAMPFAVQYEAQVAVAQRPDRELSFHALDMDDSFTLHLDQCSAPASGAARTGTWRDYVAGVARTLLGAGVPLRGADLMIRSSVPIGAGLSSSAALEVAVTLALLDSAGFDADPLQIARWCQAVENIHVGAQSGLLDPLASLFGEPDHALLLDFRSLRVSPVPLPDCALVVCDTLVRHSHASGEYNLRRSECEQGLRELQTLGLGIQSLRDIDMPELQAARPNLQDVSWRRCHHVVSENLRVTSMQHALLEGNLVFAGELMRASHASLRDDFQVSCAELDLLVELAGGIPGVFGARMTGGGFGGCTINLVSTDALPGFRRRIIERYLASTGKTPQLHECSAVRGAGRLS